MEIHLSLENIMNFLFCKQLKLDPMYIQCILPNPRVKVAKE